MLQETIIDPLETVKDWLTKGLNAPTTMASTLRLQETLGNYRDAYGRDVEDIRLKQVEIKSLFDSCYDLGLIVKKIMFEHFNYEEDVGGTMPHPDSNLFRSSIIFDLKFSFVPEEFMEYLIGSETRHMLMVEFYHKLDKFFYKPTRYSGNRFWDTWRRW